MISLTRKIAGFTRAVRGRLQVMELRDLDNAALRDIGLTRGDVNSALRTPYDRDPSLVLKWLCCQGSLRAQSDIQACC